MLKELMERQREQRDAIRGRPRVGKSATTEELEQAAESMKHAGAVARRQKAEHNLSLAKRAPGKLKFRIFLNKESNDADE